MIRSLIGLICFMCKIFFIAFKESLGNRWISHTWSLGLEEQFYLILPLLIYFLKKKNLAIVLTLCVLSAPVFRFFIGNWFQTFNLIYCRFDSLFMGVLIAMAMQNEVIVSFFKKNITYITSLLWLMIIITLLFSFRVIHLYYFISNSWFSLLFTLLLVVVFTNDKSVFSRISRNMILVRTGIISYGMYLYHPLISGILHLLIKGQTPRIQDTSDLCLTILSFIITVIVSHFSYNYFEKRGILFGHKFEY